MPEEVRFVLRLSVYGFLIAVIYWFVSYEVAGTVLLLGFGLAAGFATLLLALDIRRRRQLTRFSIRDWIGLTDTRPDGPFVEDPAGVPRGSLAPLEFGLGTAIIALGLVFGSWLLVFGLVPVIVGAAAWLREGMAEYRLVSIEDPEDPPAVRPS